MTILDYKGMYPDKNLIKIKETLANISYDVYFPIITPNALYNIDRGSFSHQESSAIDIILGIMSGKFANNDAEIIQSIKQMIIMVQKNGEDLVDYDDINPHLTNIFNMWYERMGFGNPIITTDDSDGTQVILIQHFWGGVYCELKFPQDVSYNEKVINELALIVGLAGDMLLHDEDTIENIINILPNILIEFKVNSKVIEKEHLFDKIPKSFFIIMVMSWLDVLGLSPEFEIEII